MKIAIGADHGGFELKESLKPFLVKLGHKVKDFGCYSPEPCDYPKYGYKVAKAVSEIRRGGAGRRFERGVLICKSGVGISIVANKVKGIRAAIVNDRETAQLSRLHNDANVIIFGANFVKEARAKQFLSIWLKTPFEGGRHLRRVKQIERIERMLHGTSTKNRPGNS